MKLSRHHESLFIQLFQPTLLTDLVNLQKVASFVHPEKTSKEIIMKPNKS